MRRWILCIALACGLVLAGNPASTGSGVARAQVWSPKGKRKHKRRAKPTPKKTREKKAREEKARKKRRRTRRRRARPKKRAKPKVDDETIVDEPVDGDDDKPVDDDDDTSSDNDDTSSDNDDTEDDGESLTIDDDLDDVGAKVTFSKKDLTSDASTADGASVTRLETLVMAFAQLRIDTVQDPAPDRSAGFGDIGEEVIAFRGHARAEGTSRFGRSLKVKVAGRIYADLSIDSNTQVSVQRYETEVWDTYVDYYASHVDFRVGKQIVAWGVADLLSPNDVVNARELRRSFFADRPEDIRLPVLALSTTVYDGPFSLQALWIPVAPTNRFELLDGDYALLGPNAPTAAERRIGGLVSALAKDPMFGPAVSPILDIDRAPDSSLDTGELGAALSLRFKRIDFHGYALWGHERNPRIVLAPALRDVLVNTPPDMLTPELIANQIGALAQMGVAAVNVDYPRRMHVGGAVATRLEPVGIKAEVGYALSGNTIIVAPGNGRLLAEPLSLPQLGGTVSIDYDRGSDLTIILEASHLRVFDVPSDRTVYQYNGDRLTLLGGRMQWTPRSGPVSFNFLGFVDIDSPSYILKPGVRLSGHDNLSVEIAAAFYGGPAGSFGGDASRNDEVMLTVQYGL